MTAGPLSPKVSPMGDRMAGPLEMSIRSAELKWLETWVRGPIDVAVSDMPLQVGDQAKDYDLQSSDGHWLRLSHFWSAGPALVVFLRPFGCLCSHERVRRLESEARRLRRLGASLVMICQADTVRAAEFLQFYSPDATLLCDPDMTAHYGYGLREGTLAEVLYDVPPFRRDHSRTSGLWMMEKGRASGMHRVDNPWLIPAEFVIDGRGVIRLAYRYQHRCAMPDPELLLAALEEASDVLKEAT